MTALISSLAPARLTPNNGVATVIAADLVGFSPAIARTLIQHSGNRFPSLVHKPGAAPRVRISTPFYPAYQLLGFQAKKLTGFDFFLAKFTDHVRDAGANHTKFGLTASCTAAARIVGASVALTGILMAEIDIVPLSNTGMAHPLTVAGGQSLPTLAAEPTLHGLGPFILDGARLDGLNNQGFDLGGDFVGGPSDGDKFLRNVAEIENVPTLMGAHQDPITLLAALGLLGTKINTSAVAYFRDIDGESGEVGTTGLALTVASGVVDPTDIQLRRGDLTTSGFSLAGLSSNDTHPFAISDGVNVPA
jgi:hypothetical protein